MPSLSKHAKTFAAGIMLRQMLVFEHYYKQPEAQQIELLQVFCDAISTEELPHKVTTPYVLQNLVWARGVAWANTVFAIASPVMYLRARQVVASAGLGVFLVPVLHFPYLDNVTIDIVSETLYSDWAESVAEYVKEASARNVKMVGDLITSDWSLVNAFNACVTDENKVEFVPPPQVLTEEAAEVERLETDGFFDSTAN